MQPQKGVQGMLVVTLTNRDETGAKKESCNCMHLPLSFVNSSLLQLCLLSKKRTENTPLARMNDNKI